MVVRRLLAIQELSALGWTTTEIAEAFDVHPSRIRQHRQEIRRELEAMRAQVRDYEAARRQCGVPAEET